MNKIANLIWHFRIPHRIAVIRRYLRNDTPRVLDVGCGNASPVRTKRYLPRCIYHGIDKLPVPDTDRRFIDKFIQLDLETSDGLSAVENEWYDVIICSHVLEHLSDPYRVIAELSRKLRAGGVLYIASPSKRSTKLPRARDGWGPIRGSLNFYDDPSHQTLLDFDRIEEMLRNQEYSVKPHATARQWFRIVFMPVYFMVGLLRDGYVDAAVLWDILGFATWLSAQRCADVRNANAPQPHNGCEGLPIHNSAECTRTLTTGE